MFVDLHMHTYHSDGTMTPKEIVEEGKKKKVSIMAITDHNRITSWPELSKEAKAQGITPIRGVEINAIYKDKLLHILGYQFKESKRLLAMLKHIDEQMEQMSIDMIENLEKDDARVSLEAYRKYTYDRTKGGWEGLQYLYEKGVISELSEGFKYYKNYGKPLLDYPYPTVEEVCETLKEAGGWSVLAHPMAYFQDLDESALKQTLEDLRQRGLQGIECYYPTHSTLMTQTCEAFCKQHGLLITTGSDEHGAFGKQIKSLEQTIGCMQITREQIFIEPLLEKIEQNS